MLGGALRLSMILISVQVCVGVKVLRDWGVLTVNGESLICEVFQGLCTGQVESAEGFRLPHEYVDSPVSCAIAHTSTGQFQSISLSVKIQNAVEFGKYFKFVLRMEFELRSTQATTRNAFSILMSEAGRLVWPEKYEIARKNNRQKLYNDFIELLQEKNLGWTKQNVLSEGRPFVLQLTDILWRLDGHHDKLTGQTCSIPDFFSKFQKYNLPESYKRKRPNLKHELVSQMSQQLFNILQQVSIESLCI